MPGDAERPLDQPPALGAAFNPRQVFRGIGLFIPETIAASRELSMTAKVVYGHFVRRAGRNGRCWPSFRDIAKSIGLGTRQTMRAVKELVDTALIRSMPRSDTTRRQTSNGYEFIWGAILQGEGDKTDTLPPAKSDTGTLTHSTPTGVSEMTPLEVIKINHHQERRKQRSAVRVESTVHGCSAPESDRPSSHEVDDDEPVRTEYASGKEELKAIYLAKTGEPFRVADLDAIESLLGGRVTWETFVAEVRTHDWNRIRNPVGFLKSLAKTFRAKTQRASPAITAAEEKARNYQCPVCRSRTPGQGAVLIGGKPVPCSCASPEYIEHHRADGLFAREEPPK